MHHALVIKKDLHQSFARLSRPQSLLGALSFADPLHALLFLLQFQDAEPRFIACDHPPEEQGVITFMQILSAEPDT